MIAALVAIAFVACAGDLQAATFTVNPGTPSDDIYDLYVYDAGHAFMRSSDPQVYARRIVRGLPEVPNWPGLTITLRPIVSW